MMFEMNRKDNTATQRFGRDVIASREAWFFTRLRTCSALES